MLKTLGRPSFNKPGIWETGIPVNQCVSLEVRLASLRDMVETVGWRRGGNGPDAANHKH